MAVLPELFKDINELIDNNLDNIKKVLIVGDLNFNRSQFPPEPQYGDSYMEFMRVKYPQVLFDSLDFNGRPGVLNLNLNNDIDEYHNTYDLIIDGGTCEHVDNQIMYFYNINNFLKHKGYYYSNCIDYEKSNEFKEWIGHCFYYYSFDFFKSLEKILGWDIVNFKFSSEVNSTNSLIFTLLQKNKNIKVSKNGLKKIYNLINVVLEETVITKLNGSDLDHVKQILNNNKK